MSELIEITGNSNQNNAKWKPFVGNETTELIKFKGFTNPDGRVNEIGNRIIDETYRILEMCGNPADTVHHETGLVIGYVQSGKTMSFTTLSAMASDNDYQLIIIIAGISTILSQQSFDRMSTDLRINLRYDRKWSIIQNPETAANRDAIEAKLRQWSDPTYPRESCSTMLITVMKQTHRLETLTSLLSSLDLEGVPTLIIDDESDQASLNTRARGNSRDGIGVNEGEASTIYRRINNLRAVFNHHTFLQYTATPQANLFINIMDRLSPNFIKLLTPGEGYTGGNSFFVDNPNLVRIIPPNDIPTNNRQLQEPPDSLRYSIMIFILGVVAGDIKRDQRNRSMMIHPSRLTDSQRTYYGWVQNISEGWKRLLQSDDEDEKQVLLTEFRAAYDDLAFTVNDLPVFEELTGNRLIHALRDTIIIEVNARKGSTPQISWSDFYSHILIGGQAMSRGFTVEGLTVTYMPRNLATGQVDTTLQRARFFGYKGSYLGYCRVWLDQANVDAFTAIVEHEEDVRVRLEEFNVNNKHLDEWERELVLAQMLRLNRPNVLYDNLDRDYFGSQWFTIRAPHDTDRLINENTQVIRKFKIDHYEDLQLDEGHNERTELQRHLVSEVSLEATLEELLNRLRFTKETDSQTFSSLRGILNGYVVDNPDVTCLVYFISTSKGNGEVKQTTRRRRLNRNDEIQQLFQGKQPTRADATYHIGEVYPGDREIRETDKITIQIHRLQLLDQDGEELLNEDDQVIYNDVPSLAIWVPEQIGRDIIRQPDNQ